MATTMRNEARKSHSRT